MKNTNYGQRMDGNMTSGQRIQDNQKFLENVYLNPLSQYQSSNYVDPSDVMYDSPSLRGIDPSPETLSQTDQGDEEYNFSSPIGNDLRRSYPDPPNSNAPTDPYYIQNNLNSTDVPVLAQQASFEASIAISRAVAGESIAANNYNSNHATMMEDQSREIPSSIDREVHSTQIDDLYGYSESEGSYSEVPETRNFRNEGTTKRKRTPWTMRAESAYPRVWMTEQEMKLIDPEYEKNPRLAFRDMTNAKNGMKSFQINWDQVEVLNEHRRNAVHQENELMKRYAPGTYVPNFVPKIYCPKGRLRECRDEWLRKKETGDVSDSWTNRKRRTADHKRYQPELKRESTQ
ncbi:hypothetical protein ACHAQE_001132 [Botrytis cinerea]